MARLSTCSWVLALLFLGLAAAPPDRALQAQEGGAEAKQTTGRDPGAALLTAAFQLSQKSPRTIAEFTAIIDGAENGIEQATTERWQKYGQQLAAWAYSKRGQLMADADEPDNKKILADFERAVAHHAKSSDTAEWSYYHHRGVSYAIDGQFDKALADFNQVLKLRPNFGKEYFNRAEVYSALSQFGKARDDYNSALDNGHRESTVYSRRGFAHFKLDNLRSALADYNRAIQLNSRDFEALTYRGDVQAANGDFGAAIRDYQQAIAIDNTFGRTYFSAAWFRATCPDAEYRSASLALRSARRAIELDGENHRYLDALAAAHARAGEFDDAVAAIKKAIAMAPKSGVDALKARLALYEEKKAYVSVQRSGEGGKQ